MISLVTLAVASHQLWMNQWPLSLSQSEKDKARWLKTGSLKKKTTAWFCLTLKTCCIADIHVPTPCIAVFVGMVLTDAQTKIDCYSHPV